VNLCKRSILGPWLIATLLLIAGCAHPTRDNATNGLENSFWQGRLAVRIDSDPVQSFSAGFELSGNAKDGELVLFNPLGGTVASLRWSAQAAVLRSNGETRHFDTLSELVQQATGTELPLAALFLWLAGDNATASGWQADLRELATGRLFAQRLDPAPRVELRIALEK
jgi:outer membrane lipoprotein LolB